MDLFFVVITHWSVIRYTHSCIPQLLSDLSIGKNKKFLQPSIITMTVIIILVSTIISILTVNQILIYFVY